MKKFKKLKKIISLVTSLCIAAGISICPAAVSAADYQSGILALMSELNIISGDPDGNLRLDDCVSRAEFTKIAVNASNFKNSVATNLSVSPFPDVTYRHWAAPYVRVGVTNGIISGYPDATFRPEDTVLYEEAVTMMLRVLGYTNADFGVSWPSGQIGLADNLDMTDNIGCSAGDYMTRRQVVQLVYNTLKTKMKNSQSQLISVFDAEVKDDVTVIGGSEEDSSIASDEVFTTGGTFKINTSFDKTSVGMKGDAVIKDGSKLIAFVPSANENAASEYIVYSVLNNKVMAYRNGSMTSVEISDGTAAYKGKNQTTFGAMKGELELGDKLKVSLSDSGEVDYVTFIEGNVEGPVTASGSNWQSMWNTGSDTKITRDGASVKASDIQTNDIVYYLKDLNMVLAYSSKVSGIYEKASPNRDVPTSITVSGKEYELEGASAFNKVYSGGVFEYGDSVTILLGKDGKAADVISPSSATSGSVGYVTATGTKSYASGDVNTFTNYYVRIAQPNGEEYEYITDKDYSELKNSIVEISFHNGNARLSHVNTSANVSGTFNWSSKKIGSSAIASNVDILDIGTTDKTYTSAYAKVFGPRIDGVKIDSKKILYLHKNSSGAIDTLILDNVTNDSYTYGLVTYAKTNGNSSSYDILADGSRYTVSTRGKFSISKGDAVKISGNIASPDIMNSLHAENGKITSVSFDKIVINNKTSKLSDKVTVYKRSSVSSSEYVMISVDDLMAQYKDLSCTVFEDETTTGASRVRLIVVSET